MSGQQFDDHIIPDIFRYEWGNRKKEEEKIVKDLMTPMPTSLTDTSWANQQPSASLDDIRKGLENALEIMNKDPLLSRGIGSDHHAVVHPSMVHPIVDFIKKHDQENGFDAPWQTDDMRLRKATGRHTFIIPEATIGEIEYGTYAAICAKYPEWYKRNLDILGDSE